MVPLVRDRSTHSHRPFALFARDAGGAVAVMFAAALAGLVGVAALVYDLGRAWNLDTELQGAVDAAALAGASQLDGRPGARLRAVQAATGILARNGQIFANVSGPGAVTYSADFPCTGDGCAMINENFRFFSNLKSQIDALSDLETRYVEVRVERTVGFFFAGLVGALTRVSPRARAVAGLQTFICGQVSLLICNPDEPPGNLDPGHGFDVTRHLGTGITLREGRGALFPGEFAWLAVVRCEAAGDTCTTVGGLDALADALGEVVAPQTCIQGVVQVQPGTIAQLADFVNMRMDIYPTGAAEGPSSNPRFQPSPNFLTGLVADPAAMEDGQLTACDFNTAGDDGSAGALRPPDNPFLGPDRHAPNGIEPLDHMGYPRDDCAYLEADGTVPRDNCIAVPPADADIAVGSQLGTGLWDLDAYMAHHHPGVSINTVRDNVCRDSGCAIDSNRDVDLDGDRRLSRWEIYSWEKQRDLPDFGRPQCFGRGTAALPQPPATDFRVPDRRLLGAVVVNCSALSQAGGAADRGVDLRAALARPDPAVNIFLTEALGELAPDAFYGEIVGPAAIKGQAAAVGRDRVMLSE